jgi:radical SAM-linked protein
MEGFSLAPWLEALAEFGLNPLDYTRERSYDEALPWDHLRSGLRREYLLRERRKALAGIPTADCRYSVCNQCGVCDTKAGPSLLDPLPGANGNREKTGYANILNKARRDQEAHVASFDEHGRILVRGRADGENEKKRTGLKAAPPALAPHLGKKAVQFRFWYARTGPAAYLSQLEVQHIFDRALRKAKLPLSFSQGFHPLPLVSYGRALPVGVASECEWFSVYLREHRPLPETLTALNSALPRGLRLLSVENRPLEKKSADEAMEAFRVETPAPPEERAGFFSAWRRIAQSPSLPWRLIGKKGARELDARSYFADIDCSPPGFDAACAVLIDWSGGYVSPLALCLHALAAVGFPVELPSIRLTKIPRGDG